MIIGSAKGAEGYKKAKCKHPKDAWLVDADADPIEDGVDVFCTDCERDVTQELSDEDYNTAKEDYLENREYYANDWWEDRTLED